MPFALTEFAPCTIRSVTPRTETHGDEKVPAISVGLSFHMPNTALDMLSPGLCAMLYQAPPKADSQIEIEEARVIHLPMRRAALIDSLHLGHKLEGWKVVIDFGIDESSHITLAESKIDKFVVVPIEGGSIELTLRVGSSSVDEDDVGKLWGLLGTETAAKILAPEKKPDVIDASSDGDFGKSKDATDLFVEG